MFPSTTIAWSLLLVVRLGDKKKTAKENLTTTEDSPSQEVALALA